MMNYFWVIVVGAVVTVITKLTACGSLIAFQQTKLGTMIYTQRTILFNSGLKVKWVIQKFSS